MTDSSTATTTAAASKAMWQLKPRSLVDRNRIFVGKDLLADVHLIVGPEKSRLPAHRYILSITSWIFYNSFYLLHLNEFQMGDDVSVEDARTFLEYIYTDQLALDKHNVYGILRLAINFEIDHLEQECIAFIERHLLTIENVIDILTTANDLNSLELSRKTKQVIEWTILDVMQTRSFLQASRSTLELILDMPRLNCTEFQLYQGVLEWAVQTAKRQSKKVAAPVVVGRENTTAVVEATPTTTATIRKRDLLDKCLFKIRFPTMNAEEFSECAKEAELLSADEIRAIFLRIMNKTSTAAAITTSPATSTTTSNGENGQDENPNALPTSDHNLLLFSDQPRQIKLGFHVSGIWIFNRFIKWSPNLNAQQRFAKHSTLVRVNKPVVIVGLGLLMRHDDLSLTDISVQINGRTERLNDKRTELMYRLELDNGLDIVRLLLDQPVFLETDEVYLITIMHETGHLLEIDGQVRDTIVNEDLGVTFVKPKQSPYINSIAEVFIHKG